VKLGGSSAIQESTQQLACENHEVITHAYKLLAHKDNTALELPNLHRVGVGIL